MFPHSSSKVSDQQLERALQDCLGRHQAACSAQDLPDALLRVEEINRVVRLILPRQQPDTPTANRFSEQYANALVTTLQSFPELGSNPQTLSTASYLADQILSICPRSCLELEMYRLQGHLAKSLWAFNSRLMRDAAEHAHSAREIAERRCEESVSLQVQFVSGLFTYAFCSHCEVEPGRAEAELTVVRQALLAAAPEELSLRTELLLAVVKNPQISTQRAQELLRLHSVPTTQLPVTVRAQLEMSQPYVALNRCDLHTALSTTSQINPLNYLESEDFELDTALMALEARSLRSWCLRLSWGLEEDLREDQMFLSELRRTGAPFPILAAEGGLLCSLHRLGWNHEVQRIHATANLEDNDPIANYSWSLGMALAQDRERITRGEAPRNPGASFERDEQLTSRLSPKEHPALTLNDAIFRLVSTPPSRELFSQELARSTLLPRLFREVAFVEVVSRRGEWALFNRDLETAIQDLTALRNHLTNNRLLFDSLVAQEARVRLTSLATATVNFFPEIKQELFGLLADGARVAVRDGDVAPALASVLLRRAQMQAEPLTKRGYLTTQELPEIANRYEYLTALTLLANEETES